MFNRGQAAYFCRTTFVLDNFVIFVLYLHFFFLFTSFSALNRVKPSAAFCDRVPNAESDPEIESMRRSTIVGGCPQLLG